MVNSQLYYKELLARFIRDELNAEDIKVLYAFIKDDPGAYEAIINDQDIIALAESQSKYFGGSLSGEADQKLKQDIFSYIERDSPIIRHLPKPQGANRMWYWAAASAVVLLGLGIYFSTSFNKQRPAIAVVVPKDIPAPLSNRAMITFADGSQFYLDSVNDGQLAQMGNIKLVKLANGQIAYQSANGQMPEELQYNTLTNPRGSKIIDLQLSDGSRVFLNAGSSITYPVAFINDERKVELKGEGYFEVTKDEKKKFIVAANGVSTEVLGTHFNINAYEDEKDIKVTLLEGSVSVRKGNINDILVPGQQAQVTNDVKVINDVDLKEVMAWKNGYFQFEGAGIEDVMRQISRWYDVEVVYEVQPTKVHFRGSISRNVEASKVFSMLETTKAVHFRIEGKKVYVIR